MFSRHGVIFNFTYIEMKDWEHLGDAQFSLKEMIKQVILVTRKAWIPLAGDNALPIFDQEAYKERILCSLAWVQIQLWWLASKQKLYHYSVSVVSYC